MSKKLTQEEFEKRVYELHGDEYTVIGTYMGADKPIEIRHNVCGCEFTIKYAGYICYRKGKLKCPRCTENGFVDALYPQLLQNMENPKDAHDYISSRKKIVVICPCCGKKFITTLQSYVKSGHVLCPTCCDGFPYPEKYMANVLDQLGIKYNYQYSPDWALGYRYDFEFIFNDTKYIIETDGGLGHGHKTIDPSLSPEDTKKDDEIKDNLAYENGHTMIRVDCNYQNKNRQLYIESHIIDTLSSYFDLSCVNWKACHVAASSSKFIHVINIYCNHSVYLDEIEKYTGVKERTVKKYLYEAMKVGILPKATIQSTNPYKGLPLDVIRFTEYCSRNRLVYCYEEAKLFQSITDCALYYGFKREGLGHSIRNENGYYKGMRFCFYDELPNDFDFQPMVFDDSEYNSHSIAQCDLNGNIVRIYKTASDIPKEYCYCGIFKVITNQRNTAYGYKWRYITKKEEFNIF